MLSPPLYKTEGDLSFIRIGFNTEEIPSFPSFRQQEGPLHVMQYGGVVDHSPTPPAHSTSWECADFRYITTNLNPPLHKTQDGGVRQQGGFSLLHNLLNSDTHPPIVINTSPSHEPQVREVCQVITSVSRFMGIPGPCHHSSSRDSCVDPVTILSHFVGWRI